MNAETLTQLEVQVAIPLLVGLVGIGLAWIKKRLNLQEASTAAQLDATANLAIQGAVANFAGKVAADLTSGRMTQGQAVAGLQAHLAESVSDSLARLAPSMPTLTTMLLGKVAAVAGVPVSTPSTAPGGTPVSTGASS